jgi:hypothetical protein
MRIALWSLAALAPTVATSAFAAEEEGHGRRASAVTDPSWEFAATAYPTSVRNGDNYTSAVFAADRGPLHLEARANYESIGARSAFVGWTFSGGETVTWEVTPIVGGAWGTAKAFVPGLEASVAWGRIDFYVEAEYVRDRSERSSSYTYAWSELGVQALEWLGSGLPLSAAAPTAPSAMSSAGRLHRRPGATSPSAATGSTRGRASRSSSLRSACRSNETTRDVLGRPEISIGGAGGNRTPVRKPSPASSTCVAV